MNAVDHDQKQAPEEQITEASETELLMKISAEELKSVLENLVESKLSALQVIECLEHYCCVWPHDYALSLWLVGGLVV